MALTYDKEFCTMEMICDDCNELGEFSCDDFACGIDQFKDDGWTISNTDGNYTHKCPDCNNRIMEEKI